LTVWGPPPTAGHWLTGFPQPILPPGIPTPAPTGKPGMPRIWHNYGMVTTPPTHQSGILKSAGYRINMPPVG
jgi:hypothetical protein